MSTITDFKRKFTEQRLSIVSPDLARRSAREKSITRGQAKALGR
jgi:hypothetical protein